MALRTVVNATSHPDAGLSAVPSVVAPLWSLVKGLRGSGVVRAAVSVVGVIAALALQPEPGRPVGVTSMRARVLLLSAQARRYLFLQYRSYATEFMGCLIGTIRGDAVVEGSSERGGALRGNVSEVRDEVELYRVGPNRADHEIPTCGDMETVPHVGVSLSVG